MLGLERSKIVAQGLRLVLGSYKYLKELQLVQELSKFVELELRQGQSNFLAQVQKRGRSKIEMR